MMYLVLVIAIISTIFAMEETENDRLQKFSFGIAFITQFMVLVWIYESF